jgi:hypothetical protein
MKIPLWWFGDPDEPASHFQRTISIRLPALLARLLKHRARRILINIDIERPQ